MPISELSIPDRGDRPDPPRPLEDDPAAVELREAHASGEALVGAIARVDVVAGLLLIAIVAVDLGLLTLFDQAGRPVFSVGAGLALRGQLERTPLGSVPRNWPTTPHPSSAALLLGGVTGSMMAVGSIFLGLGFGLSRFRPWARWGQAATIVCLCGSIPLFAAPIGQALLPSDDRLVFASSPVGLLAILLATVFVGATLFVLWSPAVRPVFRCDYAEAVARSPRLRTWTTGRALPATILVGVLGFALFGLIVVGPLAMLGEALFKEALRITYGG